MNPSIGRLVSGLAAGAALALGLGAIALAAPTPPPGGANQIGATSGKIGQTLFNGVLRVTVQSARDATPDDNVDKAYIPAGQKLYVMSVLLKNGWHGSFIYLMAYTLADGDSVTKQISQPYVHPADLSMEQGAATRQAVRVLVDKDFHPTKLLVECGGCPPSMHFVPLRVTLTP